MIITIPECDKETIVEIWQQGILRFTRLAADYDNEDPNLIWCYMKDTNERYAGMYLQKQDVIKMAEELLAKLK